jgi:hypothetical protein
MKTITEHKIATTGRTVLELPAGAELLGVVVREQDLYLVVLADAGQEVEQKVIDAYATDADLPANHGAYVGIAVVAGAAVHVFDGLAVY